MPSLVAGLLLLLMAQQIRARPARSATLIAKYGWGSYWTGLGAVALAGLAFIAAGKAHAQYIYAWLPPAWLYVFVLPLMFAACVCLAAEFVPSNLRRLTRHPVLLGVVLWAVAHLIVNEDLASILMFGGFGLLALLEIGNSARLAASDKRPVLPWLNESLPIAVGGLLFFFFNFLHPSFFGPSPLNMGRLLI